MGPDRADRVEFTTAAAEHGLGVGFGDTGSVGIGGITLGGGVGYLVRKHGLTIDDLLAADIVTADGEIRRVDAENEPDLFWAIRGGGGNFGVATRFRFGLHQIDTVVGGMLLLPATVDTIAGFMVEAEAAPEELSSIANVMPAPPMPFVPEEAHGKLVIMALMTYAGETEAGRVPSRRSERSPSRSPTCSGRCRIPRSIRPRRRSTIRSRRRGPCSSTRSALPRPRRSSSTSGPRPR